MQQGPSPDKQCSVGAGSPPPPAGRGVGGWGWPWQAVQSWIVMCNQSKRTSLSLVVTVDGWDPKHIASRGGKSIQPEAQMMHLRVRAIGQGGAGGLGSCKISTPPSPTHQYSFNLHEKGARSTTHSAATFFLFFFFFLPGVGDVCSS